jgi:hypothetical protein
MKSGALCSPPEVAGAIALENIASGETYRTTQTTRPDCVGRIALNSEAHADNKLKKKGKSLRTYLRRASHCHNLLYNVIRSWAQNEKCNALT